MTQRRHRQISFLWTTISLVSFVSVALAVWRLTDSRNDRLVWNDLIQRTGSSLKFYESSMINGLPEPAKRYFNYMIVPGTPLVTAVEIEMIGDIGFGTKDDPKYQPMNGHQILAPPYGLVWKLKSGAISGSDGATPSMSWTRFWLAGLIPVVRVGGNPDHLRSAFGRVVSEAAFWSPASLLPSDDVCWEQISENSARAIVSFGKFEQAVEVTVGTDGQPLQVVIPRWSNENEQKYFREQPFGGYLDEFRVFGGYRLPTRIEGGNHFGTDNFFPFYKAKVVNVRLLGVRTD